MILCFGHLHAGDIFEIIFGITYGIDHFIACKYEYFTTDGCIDGSFHLLREEFGQFCFGKQFCQIIFCQIELFSYVPIQLVIGNFCNSRIFIVGIFTLDHVQHTAHGHIGIGQNICPVFCSKQLLSAADCHTANGRNERKNAEQQGEKYYNNLHWYTLLSHINIPF